jgi:hypothetical protein
MALEEIEPTQKTALETDHSNIHLATESDQGPTLPMKVDSVR